MYVVTLLCFLLNILLKSFRNDLSVAKNALMQKLTCTYLKDRLLIWIFNLYCIAIRLKERKKRKGTESTWALRHT